MRSVSGKSIEIGSLRDGKRNSGLDRNDPSNLPAVHELPSDASRMQPVPRPDGEFVGPTDGRHIGDIARGNIPVQSPIEAVRDRIIGDWSGEDRGVEHRGRVINQLGARVADQKGESVGESLFQPGLHRVVVRIADIVAEESYVREPGKRLQELDLSDALPVARV